MEPAAAYLMRRHLKHIQPIDVRNQLDTSRARERSLG